MRASSSNPLSSGWFVLIGLALFAPPSSASAAATPLPAVTVPRLAHPGAGQMFYFLLVDRFANGSRTNDTGGLTGGADVHGFDPTSISHYHGGDLAGLVAKLDYLERLGITAVWVSPPLKNKPVQGKTAGYHGYWVVDFLQVDPHFGTNAEFHELIRQAHARGIKVFMDIITNHTADVIVFRGDEFTYRPREAAPYRDAAGKPFDERAVAYNGLHAPTFPTLAAERSFPYVPIVPAAEATVKNPAWLNDVTLYHNRGNTRFEGESAVLGDFVGLDDLFTEHPRVVQGFIEIFSRWLESGIDGFRIDTARHVNFEFWQAFAPALRARARELGRPGFLQFGEVYNDAGDPAVLGAFSTDIPIDTTLDFGFFAAARDFVSRGGDAATLGEFFAKDDYYTDHDSNVHATTTFLGNHDAGRFGYFLRQDNAGAPSARLAALAQLGHGLLFLARGQPVVYYGDEQGMTGTGGDTLAREDMFASQTPTFRELPLLGTTRTGADDKFDETHPFYRLIRALTALRRAHPTLVGGAMLPRPTTSPHVFAFSRIDREEQREYLVALNNSRTETIAASLPTSQRPGATLSGIFSSEGPGPAALQAGDRGETTVTLGPLQFAVWRAEAPLAPPAATATITLVKPAPDATLAADTREVDGLPLATRREISAQVRGGDGFAEVTFVMKRASRPDQFEYLGTDDSPPYRIFWRPPADLAPGETLTFIATLDDRRGHRVTAQAERVRVAPTRSSFGTKGAIVPVLRRTPPPALSVGAAGALRLEVTADGTAPLEYQWLRSGEVISGATAASYSVANVTTADAGRYSVLVRNREGSAIAPETVVTVSRAEGSGDRAGAR